MKLATIIAATSLAAGFALSAHPQQTQGQAAQLGASAPGAGQQQSAVQLPEACRTAAQSGPHASMMPDMQNRMQTQMQGMQSMMAGMPETQRGLHEAMMRMNGPMMTGMMAGDPDVAWICAMIPHHQGAIEMARAGLRGADNAESKRLAEKTIREQERSIAELTEWLDKNARREGNR